MTARREHRESVASLLLIALVFTSCGDGRAGDFFARDAAWVPRSVTETDRYVIHSPYEKSPGEGMSLEYHLRKATQVFACPDHARLWVRLIPVATPPPADDTEPAVIQRLTAVEQARRIIGGYFTRWKGHPCVVVYVPESAPVAGIFWDRRRMDHELAHFLIAEREWSLPLWLEEGIASVVPLVEWDLDLESASLPKKRPEILFRKDRDHTLWTAAMLDTWTREGDPDTVSGPRESQLVSASRSLVYYVFERLAGPVPERIAQLSRMTSRDLHEQERGWLSWIERLSE